MTAASATLPSRPLVLCDRRFAWLLTVAFALLTLPRLLYHELWRDEAWQFLVVAESHSLGELADGLDHGGGQGYAFPLLCYAAHHASSSPLGMQLCHLLVASVATFAFVCWAPFPRWQRALFVLGYFPFYEFAVISRGGYLTAMLAIWLACRATKARRAPLWFGLAIALLAQTTVHGILVGGGLVAGWAADRWRHRRESPPAWRELVLGAALAAVGLLCGLQQISPAPGTHVPFSWELGWNAERARRVAALAWRAFVPLPDPQLHFWNTNLLDPYSLLQVCAGLTTLLVAIALLRRSRLSLIAFTVGAAGLYAFSYLYFHGQVRHMGHLWILFVAAAWLGDGAGLDEPRSWRRRVFATLLAVQVAAGLYASWMDLRHPFSNGAAAAALIEQQHLGSLPLLGHREPPAASVALHLGRPLWSPSREVYTTHPDWGPRYREMGDAELRCKARELAVREGSDVVLVINHPLPRWEEVDALGGTSGAIERVEDYSLYRLRLERLPATAALAACPGNPAAGR